MRIIDSITPLLLDSKLFHDPTRTKEPEAKKRKKNLTHMGLKIGQGGTLDPLADGVLGELGTRNLAVPSAHYRSHRREQGNEASQPIS
jgi:hypothetical protein